MTARILVATSRYYTHIAEKLEAGAAAVLEPAGADVETIEVPGALEVPGIIAMAADSGRYDGYIALGCVIRGETSHYDIVCNESARGLTLLGVERRLAIGNGILTVENEAQALARADREQLDKGGGAARACLAMVDLRKRFVR
ncbi:MAG: 6,7-dimethyl-8-ribityllumazine synthase [Pseudomonadota bacterium]